LDVAAAVRSFPMFQGLSPAELNLVLPLAQLRSYAKGDVIFREGDPPLHLWLIVRGVVKIVRQAGDRDLILEILGPRETFGEVATYDGIPYPATATAAEATTVLVIRRDDFFGLIERHPALARGLLRELTRHLRLVTRRLEELTTSGIERRIALLFVRLAERLSTAAPGGTFVPLALSRQDIAEMVGTTIETAIRVMSRWAKEGQVLTEKDGFRIPDLAALRAIAATEG
jgi:CRP/FNR family transcriptional regulator